MEFFIEEIKDISAELGIANRRRKILAIANHRVNQHYAPLGGQDLFTCEVASVVGKVQEVSILCSLSLTSVAL